MDTQDQEYQKILELLLTKESANDLIALELIKGIKGEKIKFVYPLLAVAISTQNMVLSKDIYQLIKPYISIDQYSYLMEKFLGEDFDWRLWMRLKKNFSDPQIAQLAYYSYLKLEDDKIIYPFLLHDDGNHFARNEMFEEYLKYVKTNGSTEIFLQGLLPLEAQEYIKVQFKKTNVVFKSLSIDIERNKEIPNVLFSLNFDAISYSFGSTTIFPIELFNFSEVKKFDFSSKNFERINFPENWNTFHQLEELNFWGRGRPNFNSEHAATLPNLKKVFLSDVNYLKNPEMLGWYLENKSYLVWNNKFFQPIAPKIEKDENGEYHAVKQEGDAKDIAIALRESNLTLNRRIDLFYKLIKLDTFEKVKDFSIEDIEALKLLKFPEISEHL